MSSIGQRLQDARSLADDLGPVELSELAGLTRGHVWGIEAGGRSNIELRTAIAIAGVLGVPLVWLATGEGPTPSKKRVREAVERARAARPARRKPAA